MRSVLSIAHEHRDFRGPAGDSPVVWVPASGSQLTLTGWTVGTDTATDVTLFVGHNASGNRLVDFPFEENSGESRSLVPPLTLPVNSGLYLYAPSGTIRAVVFGWEELA